MVPRESNGSFTLMFGAGERLATLRSLLGPLAGAPRIKALDDLELLLDAPESAGTLVLDADRLSPDDVVFVRRFANRRPDFRVVLLGDDASRRVARELLRLDRARWIAWPPDVEHLLALAEPALSVHAPAANAPIDGTPARASDEVDEIAEIEAILGTPRGARTPRARAPDELGARTSRPSEPDERATTSTSNSPAPTQPAPYFREQVADLADIAQRIELTLNVARESSPEDSESSDGTPLAGLASEVARLMQFTRTLGYLVAPPESGEQVFDVGEMLDVLIAGGEESPRYVFRRDRALFVRSDRQLLGQAFDAFLCLARNAGRRELVRVDVKGAADDDPNFGIVTIEFPAGALQGVDLARAIEPYALRRVLPELGANALAAAMGIVAGQGGRAELHPSTEGRLEWTIRLRSAPRADPAVAAMPAWKRTNDPIR